MNVTETIFGKLNESSVAESGNVTLNDRSNLLTIVSSIENNKLKQNVEGQTPKLLAESGTT